jgi:hypothetical protein
MAPSWEPLSGDLEDRSVGTKRKRLLGAGERKAVVAKLGGVRALTLLCVHRIQGAAGVLRSARAYTVHIAAVDP